MNHDTFDEVTRELMAEVKNYAIENGLWDFERVVVDTSVALEKKNTTSGLSNNWQKIERTAADIIV